MLVILVASACVALALVLVGLSLCRAAAISDRSDPLARFESAASERVERAGGSDPSLAQSPPPEPRRRTRRAAG